MRLSLLIFISLIAFVVIMIGNYFSYQTPQYQKNTKYIKRAMKTAHPIKDTNNWIRTNIVPYIDTLETIDQAENSLIKEQELMQKQFELIIDEMDKTPNGYIKISASCKVYRNDIKKMLKLFKNDIRNGYIKIKEVYMDDVFIHLKFDMIKFYKEK
ncbi:MAG: hypothetical protein U9Q04_07810 [Campylobacterota bacterium]|nr:hypothetical protein [Campylobacterota bacterium]